MPLACPCQLLRIKMVKTEWAMLGETWRLKRGCSELEELGQVLIVWQAYVWDKQKFQS